MYSAAQVRSAVDRLAVRVNAELAEANPVMLVVMHGALPFAADLLARFRSPCELAYVHVARYGNETSGSDLRWLQPPSISLRDRCVLIVDDVLDRGETLSELRTRVIDLGAARTCAAVFVRKNVPGCISHAEYVGLDSPNRFLFGYGMDYQGYWRNLREIRAMPEPTQR
jgi:hypoxanthine phosphoribosyltransferase